VSEKARQLTCCLTALSGNDFAGSFCTEKKLISDRLLRQRFNDLQQNREKVRKLSESLITTIVIYR